MNEQVVEEVFAICTKELLVPFESYAKKLADGSCAAYPDPASKLVRLSLDERDMLSPEEYEQLGRPWTIGYGSTFDEDGKPIKPNTIWSQARALYVKKIALRKFYNYLLGYSPDLYKEHPRRQAAVLSWIYNLGPKNYQISIFRKRINEESWEEAAEECKKWDKAGGSKMRGLTRRRLAESIRIIHPDAKYE
jgi:lysozyme